MIEYIRLLRPLQWLKNVFVFAPIFFSNNLLKPAYFWPTLVVFVSCRGRPSASEEMSSPDCLRKSLHQKRLRDDDTLHDWCLGSVATGPKSQYTLFIYDRGGLLADEHRLLYPYETICHPGCVDYRHWVCDASVGGWCYDRYLDLPLAGDDDLPRDAFPGLHQT